MRIWVARPEPGAARTGRRLRELGHTPVVAPILSVAATGVPAPAGPFAAVLLTSAQAVDALAAADLGPVAVLAVGARTAERACAAGFARVVAAEGDAAGLVRLVRERVAAGAQLLHVAGEDRKPEPAASLAGAGYAVTVWEAYAARAVRTLPDAIEAALAGRAAPLEAALHYSRRSAGIALGLAREAGHEAAFRALRHYSLSADVAVPLVEAGIAAHFVAARPGEEALLAGLADRG